MKRSTIDTIESAIITYLPSKEQSYILQEFRDTVDDERTAREALLRLVTKLSVALGLAESAIASLKGEI